MPDGRKDLIELAAGTILFALALTAWLGRDTISSWFASSYTANIHLIVTDEPDDSRLGRAFAAAGAAHPVGAKLMLLPQTLKHFRDADVDVPGRSNGEAVAAAETFSRALAAAFDDGGSRRLDASVYPTAYPTESATTRTARTIVTIGAPTLGLLAAFLLWIGWRDWRACPAGSALPRGAGYAAAGSIGLSVMLVVLPGWLFMALFAMAIPLAIAGKLVQKAGDVRRAAKWPSAQGHILHAQLRAEEHDGSAEVKNVADIEYAFSVNGIEHRGTRINIVEAPSNSAKLEAALDRYRAGTIVPVYYNPANPDDATLERDGPVSPRIIDAVAAAIVLVGFTVVFGFTRASEIIAWLQPHFPPGAVVQGFLFFALAGLMTLAFLLSDLHAAMAAARWPTVDGTVLSSTSQSHRMLAPGGGSRTLEVWSPVVEYSYRAGGREYRSAHVAFGAVVSGGKPLADATVARYRQGATVTVHYDPANPSLAVLDTSVAFGWLTLLLTIGFFAAAWFFSGWRFTA